jgi:hypothetical protein
MIGSVLKMIVYGWFKGTTILSLVLDCLLMLSLRLKLYLAVVMLTRNLKCRRGGFFWPPQYLWCRQWWVLLDIWYWF